MSLVDLPNPDAPAVPDLPKAVSSYLVEHWKRWPVRANRASQLGHPCLRFLTYKRTRWQEEAAPDPTLLSIFQEGSVHETAVIRQLENAGYRVLSQQTAFEYPEHTITGSIDGILTDGHTTAVPIDVKSMSPYSFRSIVPHDANSVRHHEHHYVRGYYSQMVMYCLMGEKPLGMLLFKNKTTGELKQVEVPLDYAHAEELIQKADAVNAHVAAGTLPDRIPYSEAICGKCSFFHVCLPDEALLQGVTLADDPELLEALRRRAALKASVDEYKDLDEKIKQRAQQALPEDGEAVVGTEYVVRVTTRTRKGYTVDPSSYREVKVERLGRDPTPAS